MTKKSDYSADSVDLLDGVSHIRSRPGMYVTDKESAGLHHLLWEVIDNSVDEFQAGHCTRIAVFLDTKSNVVRVDDNGRGIPVDIHPKTGKPTIESIFSNIFMGAKFRKGDNDQYQVSSGLHGIGAKATCALSDMMAVYSTRDGNIHRVVFSQGRVTQPMKAKPTTKGGTGTRVEFHPDPIIFRKHRFDAAVIRERLRGVAYLCTGLRIRLVVDGNVEELTSKAGIEGVLVDRATASKESPVFDSPLTFDVPLKVAGESLAATLWWTDGDGEEWNTWVNMVPMRGEGGGGTHVMGAKGAIARELRRYCDAKNGITSDDLRDGLRVACHVRLREPHFEGQTKNRLNNPEVQPMADSAFGEVLKTFLAKNGAITKKLVARAVEMAKAREKYKASRKLATQAAYTKDPSSRKGLPFKLNTALGCEPKERELFLVEGGSAGGLVVQGKVKYNQEVLPLRGKIPNVVKEQDIVKVSDFFRNEEIDAIIRSVGAGHDVMVPYESCDASKSRVGKVVILTDADADGGHIACLLMGFFLRFMLPMVEAGKIWIASPPLYVAKWGGGRVYGDSREKVIMLAGEKGVKKPQVSRFKGLGEMNPKQLAETCLLPASRRLTLVNGDKASLTMVSNLMGHDSSFRKAILGIHGAEAMDD